jgi:hypothetical protein
MEPQGLPPPHNHCHQIRLQAGTKPVVVRPYRYTHAQKAELECQCTEMLAHRVTRPSSSAFSALVLLIKKSAGISVSIIELSTQTIEDKFLSPLSRSFSMSCVAPPSSPSLTCAQATTGARRREDNFPNAPRSLRVPCDVVRTIKCTRHLSSANE